MDIILFEDGKGNSMDEEGAEASVIEMEVDEDEFLLDETTNYDTYIDLKPPERPVKVKQEKYEAGQEEKMNDNITRTYRLHKPDMKVFFYYLVYEEGSNIRAVTKKLKVLQSTAQSWINKAKQAGDDDFEERRAGSGRPASKPPTLDEGHKEFLVN